MYLLASEDEEVLEEDCLKSVPEKRGMRRRRSDIMISENVDLIIMWQMCLWKQIFYLIY